MTAEQALLELLSEAQESQKEWKLLVDYAQPADIERGLPGPYEYQLEFHNAGKDYRQRMACWGNQIGKTVCGAAETAIHLTGLYPEWWEGYRFDHPIEAIAAGMSNAELRTKIQPELLGKVEGKACDGTGWIPKPHIGRVTQMPGVQDVIDTVQVQHVSGGWSKVYFKSYEQGADKFQSSTGHLAWLDEEPKDQVIYSEVKRGLMRNRGLMLFTRTPLYGMTEMVRSFHRGGPGMWMSKKGWDHCPHFTPEMVAEEAENCPDHEVACRRFGEPMMGEGAVYPVEDARITCAPFAIPDHFRRICGIDFGIDHFTAGAWLAQDPDTTVVYLYDEYKTKGETPEYHASAFKARGSWIPTSWPHDGVNREKGTGKNLFDYYMEEGLSMLPFSARYDDEKGGAQSRENATIMLLGAMKRGTFKVFSTCTQFLTEKRSLYRENNKIVDTNDDLESAVRYAYMMLRYATTSIEAEGIGRQEYAETEGYNPIRY